MVKKDRFVFGLSINIVILGIVSFLTDMSTECIVPLLPFFLLGLGATSLVIGTIEGVAESIGSFLKLISGIYSDKFRKRKGFVLAGYSISNLTKPFLAIAASPLHVLGIRVTDRVGKGIRTTPRDAIIADSSTEKDRGKAYGLHRALDTSGAVAGPLLALIVLLAAGVSMGVYRIIFALAAIPGIAAIILIFFVKDTGGITRKKFSLSMASFPRNFRIFVLSIGVFSLGNFSIAFMLLRAHQILEMPVSVEVGLYVLMNVAYAALSFPAGILADKIGRKNVLVPGMLLFALIFVAFIFANSLVIVILLFICFGVYMAMTDGITRAIGSVMVTEDVRASALGVINLVTSITIFPANFIAGFLWDLFGSWASFAFGAILAFVSAMIVWTSVKM